MYKHTKVPTYHGFHQTRFLLHLTLTIFQEICFKTKNFNLPQSTIKFESRNGCYKKILKKFFQKSFTFAHFSPCLLWLLAGTKDIMWDTTQRWKIHVWMNAQTGSQWLLVYPLIKLLLYILVLVHVICKLNFLEDKLMMA